jgi:transposase
MRPDQQQSTSTTTKDIFSYERIDAQELARRLNVPETWVRDGVRRRCADPIPCERFGKYVRFLWGFRRLVVRYERDAENFLGMLYLGCCLILLRRL